MSQCEYELRIRTLEAEVGGLRQELGQGAVSHVATSCVASKVMTTLKRGVTLLGGVNLLRGVALLWGVVQWVMRGAAE